MRRIALLVVACFALSVPALADPGCTRTGTNGEDTINGSGSRDVICLRGSDDYGNGNGAADTVRGGWGGDTVVGGAGADFLSGGPGPDQIFAVDQTPGDEIRGRDGFDRCYVDQGDAVFGCEKVVRV